MKTYRVMHRKFNSLASAIAYAQEIFKKHGVVVAITSENSTTRIRYGR